MSTFSGLNTGLSSLFAQRRGLETTGHNIANSNTVGYSRQRVRMEGVGGPVVGAVHSTWDGVGNGVLVSDVQRLRDGFLESRAVQERGTDAALKGHANVLGRIEAIFAEPSDSGIQSQLSDFWDGWDDVANNADKLAPRSALLERAHTLANGINRAAERLEAQRGASYDQLRATVDEINSVAGSVAEFNRAIQAATAGGLSPNDLADQRDVLVQRLGELTGGRLRVGEDGMVDVLVGETELVNGRTSASLVVTGGTAMTDDVAVAWAGTTPPVAAATGGSASGLLQGIASLRNYHERTMDLGEDLLARVNAQHAAGYDQSGATGAAVEPFFVKTGDRLSVGITSPAKVAASSTGPDTGGGNAAIMAERLRKLPDGPDATYRSFIVGLGVEAQAANRRVDIQSNILTQVDAAREAEAGVNLDEEMTSMLAYQRAYEGAARYLTAVDQLLDVLVNRTGMVGR